MTLLHYVSRLSKVWNELSKAKEMPVVSVRDTENKKYSLVTFEGANLRKLLIENNLSPYTRLTNKLNCGGNGICATCGVFIKEPIPAVHWHDKLAKKFNYPRLSCQIVVDRDMEVIIPEKKVWGKSEENPF